MAHPAYPLSLERQTGSRWPILAGVAGATAIATAFLPWGAGLIAVVFAGIGLAAGIAAVTRHTAHRGLAVAGLTMSVVAVVAAVVLVAIHPTGTESDAQAVDTGWIASTDNVDEILRDQLSVEFGALNPAGSSLLPVTLTSKLDRGARFSVVVAGFVRGREIARDTEYLTLAAGATQHAAIFSRYRFDTGARMQLRKAHFRVVAATTLWHPG